MFDLHGIEKFCVLIVPSVITGILLYVQKRTQIDLQVREERLDILKDIDRHIWELQTNSSEGYYRKRTQEGAYEILLLSEIYHFKNRCDVVFLKKDSQKINKLIIEPFLKIVKDSLALIKYEQSENIYTEDRQETKNMDGITVTFTKNHQKQEEYNLKRQSLFEENISNIDALDRMYTVIDDLKKRFCFIDKIYPFSSITFLFSFIKEILKNIISSFTPFVKSFTDTHRNGG